MDHSHYPFSCVLPTLIRYQPPYSSSNIIIANSCCSCGQLCWLWDCNGAQAWCLFFLRSSGSPQREVGPELIPLHSNISTSRTDMIFILCSSFCVCGHLCSIGKLTKKINLWAGNDMEPQHLWIFKWPLEAVQECWRTRRIQDASSRGAPQPWKNLTQVAPEQVMSCLQGSTTLKSGFPLFSFPLGHWWIWWHFPDNSSGKWCSLGTLIVLHGSGAHL